MGGFVQRAVVDVAVTLLPGVGIGSRPISSTVTSAGGCLV
jgi:hypothetical protein